MKQENQALRRRLQQLAGAYVPEWRFDPQDPDPGSAAALLLEDMLADSEKRFADVLRMHKVHYLNLFDRLRPDPALSARSYVRFDPVAGVEQPVYVPRGTALLAEDAQGSPSLVFETTEGITATPARLTAIVAARREQDHIVTVLDGDDAEHCVFTAFDPEPESEAHHLLTLEFDRGLSTLEAGELGLQIRTPDPQDAPAAAQRLGEEDVSFTLSGQGETELPLPRPRVQEDILWFRLEESWPACTPPETAPRWRLCARARHAMELSVCGAALVFSRTGLVPQEVRSADITQSPGRFYPFGSPLELYTECGIECPAALERPGADVTMEFDLDFETVEQTLPEVEVEVDYKVIMRKVTQTPRPEMRDVQPDYVLIEYLSTRGWKRLLPDEHAALLFNGSARGHLALSFRCPGDLLPADQLPEGYRLRLRLLRADGLYQLPCRQHVPVITGLCFSYSYASAPLEPCAVQTRNNFAEQDLLPLWHQGRGTPLFTCSERRGACLYLGFDACPQGSPLSLYFEVENHEDLPLNYGVEYLSPTGFVPVQAQDGTGGLLYSGSLLALIPADAARAVLYGKDRYWLRMVCGGDLTQRSGLPVVRGITLNMARVENRSTRTETFFVDDPRAAVRFKLGENHILMARVYVNEEQPEDPGRDHWVLWQRRTYAAQRGRFYELDTAAGAVLFDRHTFSVYAPPEGAPAVRVEYQSYQGTQGNVPAGAIHTMAEPIRYISHVSNPMAAYGGTDAGDEQVAAGLVSNLLRTRGRAVSERDYFDIIAQLGCGVRQIKCCSGIDRQGRPAADTITVALLIDEYEKGSHIFSAVKDAVRRALTDAGGMVPLGKTLVLCQPRFVRFSVRIWLRCSDMEKVYEIQRRTEQTIRRFLDPLEGGFDGRGWKIGSLPTPQQLLACLKMRDSALRVERMAMVARAGGREYAVDDDFLTRMNDPFVMAINGTHTVYVDLS